MTSVVNVALAFPFKEHRAAIELKNSRLNVRFNRQFPVKLLQEREEKEFLFSSSFISSLFARRAIGRMTGKFLCHRDTARLLVFERMLNTRRTCHSLDETRAMERITHIRYARLSMLGAIPGFRGSNCVVLHTDRDR